MGGSSWRYFLKIFIPVSLFMGIILVLFFIRSSDSGQTAISILKNEELLEQVRQSTAQLFQRKIDDLLLLAESEPLKHYLHDDNRKNWIYLARWFETFSRHRKNYDQIRFVDLDGMEKIRTIHNDGAPALIPQIDLHDISHRYYFRESIKLQKGEVYISPLDLSMEHDKIVTPLKPIIRFITPIYDGYGKKRGILIINYSARELLDHINDFFAHGSGIFSMLNSTGFGIVGPDQEHLWEFMFNRDAYFPSQYPTAWRIISENDSGRIEDDDGLFLYTTAYPTRYASGVVHHTDIGSEQQQPPHDHIKWKFVAQLPHGDVNLQHSYIEFYIALTILMLLIAVGISTIYSRISTQRQRALEELRKRANTDALTGVASRHIFAAKSSAEFSRAKRYHRDFAVIMLDIDHFKAVNDTYGHPAGDEVIQKLAAICGTIIRGTDTLARLGGEEFAFLLPETNLQDAKQLAERLCAQVASTPIETAAGAINITVSIGVSEISKKDTAFEQILKRSDLALYDSKQNGRNRVSSITA